MNPDRAAMFQQAVATLRKIFQTALAQERMQAEVALIRLENEYGASATIDPSAIQTLEDTLERTSGARYARVKAHLEQLKSLEM